MVAVSRLTGARTLLAGCVAVLLAACTPEPPSFEADMDNAAPLTDTLLQLEPGMTWRYQATGTLSAPDQPGDLPLKGHIDIRIEQREFQGEPALALIFDQQLKPDLPFGGDGPPGPPPGAEGDANREGPSLFGADAPTEAIFFFRQPADSRELIFIGDNTGPGGSQRAALDGGNLFIFGQWADGKRYNNELRWADGGVTQNFMQVDGTEVIATGIGALTSWRAPNGSLDSNGVKVSGTDWWAPQVGQPTKFEAITELPNGPTITLVAVLESTNVAVSPAP